MTKNTKARSNGAETDVMENGSEGWTRVDDTFIQHDFEKDGSLEGHYTGTKHVKPEDPQKEEFDILTFVTTDGKRVSTPANHQLKRVLDKGDDMLNTIYRITLVGVVDVEKGKMKQFEILQKKSAKPLDSSFLVK